LAIGPPRIRRDIAAAQRAEHVERLAEIIPLAGMHGAETVAPKKKRCTRACAREFPHYPPPLSEWKF
jgi:hypothetical protein